MKKQFKIGRCILLACLATSLGVSDARAFSLLGPYESWMTPTNGFQRLGDIGGPMNIGEEYRWNVPVLTYGFDQSFLDYFGTNGEAAVQGAFQILNDLPPASQTVLTNYPLGSPQINYAAQAEGLIDLKSETLFLMLQQMGLAQPQRFMFCVHDFSVSRENTNATVVLRNFDPFSFAATTYLNDTLYTSNLTWEISNGTQVDTVTITAYSVDSYAPTETAVADGGIENSTGLFYTGLTRDDAGGLAYLLSTNNVNYETLLPGVVGTGTNTDSSVNGAWRPGVDKITFVQVAVDPVTGEFFSPFTNLYTDTYITNGVLRHQQLERVTTRPDFLFCAADLNDPGEPGVRLSSSTGTTNWINNAGLNGNPGGAGPGVIQPPVQIVFNKIGRQFVSSGSRDDVASDESEFYGSFDGSTNAPIVYPIAQTGSSQFSVRMWLTWGQSPNQSVRSFDWETNTTPGTAFTMETSTNLTDWTPLFTVTNNGSVCTYLVSDPAGTDRYYRLAPQ